MDDWKSSLILSDLQAACNALGGWEDAVYVKEADCFESLKDLLRALRRDDESFAVRRALGQINVVRTDLIPLVRFYHNDEDIFDIATKLLVNLTTPVILLYKEEYPIEKNARNIYMTLESTNCTYKDAFLEKEIWCVLGERLEKLMNMSYTERSDEDKEIMERILILMRNVLHPIHKEELTLKTDGDVSSHDRLLWALHLAGIDDLIIYLCASRMEQSYTLHVLEILRLMLREQEPEFLASTGEQRSKDEIQKEVDELMREREIELRRKKLEMQSALQNRFARFSSAFQVKNVKSLNDSRDLVIVGDQAKVLQSINNVDLDKKKKFRARAKNRRPEACTSIKRRTTLNIRIFLKEFCYEFMSSAFNLLLPQARRALSRAGDAGDEGHYFWLLDFFLAFNRMTGFDISLVSAAISRETIHYVQTQMEKCHESMATDKRNVHLWVKRLHLHLKTFKQLLTTVSAMSQHKDPQVCEASKVLQSHLFLLPEYRDVALHLLLNFNENVAPVGFLRDLACTIHIYLRMLERFSDRGRVKANAAKKKVAKPKPPELINLTEEELNEKWLEVSKELTTLLDDPESELDCDINQALEGFHQYEQDFHVQICKHKIADYLRQGEARSAIGLLHACQRHFPEEECFGEISMSLEDKFMLLRKFFYAENITRMEDIPEENDDESRMQDFNFDDFLKRFVNPKVVKAYSLLLSHFRENSPEVNKVCLKMLHRIAFDMKMSAMLFQAEIFVTFDKIFEDYAIMPERSDLKELTRFAKFIVQQFTAVMKINDLALVELLFWKTSNEAYQIQYGYNESMGTNKAKPWTEEEQEELSNLYAQHKDSMEPGQDIIECVQKNFSNETRTRRQIINQLRNMGLIEKGTKFKSGSSGASSNQPWTHEEEQELQELYQKFADSIDVITQIMLEQSVKRPKFRIIEKLLELGCIHDRSQVRKRRVRKNGGISVARKRSSKRDDAPTCISKEFISTSEDSSSDDDRGRLAEEGGTAENVREHSGHSAGPVRNREQKNKKRRPKQKRRVVEKINNSEELQSLLKSAAQNRKVAVDWIIESMQDAMEDWKDSGNEPVPLVPLAPEEHEGLEDNDFCRLLSTFGFVPPLEGVEQYWRIAGDLTTSMLKSRLDVLRKASEGTFDEGIVVQGEDNDEPNQVDEGRSNSSGDEQSVLNDERSSSSDDGEPVSEKQDEADASESEDEADKSSDRPQDSSEARLPLNSRSDGDGRGSEDDARDVSLNSVEDIEERRQEDGRTSDIENGDDDGDPMPPTGATKRSHEPTPSPKTKKKRKVAIESDDSAEEETVADPETEFHDERTNTAPQEVKKKKKRAIIESDDDSEEI